MTESEWANAMDLRRMLSVAAGSVWTRHLFTLLGRQRELSRQRKLRLFVCACWRDYGYPGPPVCRAAIEVAELYADGLATRKELRAARKGTWKEVNASWCVDPADEAAHLAVADNILDLQGVYEATYLTGPLGQGSGRGAAATLRDIFGPLPFRPVAIDASWLVWGNGTVGRLAQAAYDGRQMPAGTLEPERLGVLADALEEAGCGDQEVLEHLREQGGVHVRGCWLIDLLLCKS
jgi:hypothetical protein